MRIYIYVFFIGLLLIHTGLQAQQWTEIASDIFASEQRTWSIKMVDENVVWASSSVGFNGNTRPTSYRSLDGGKTWNSSLVSGANGTVAWDIAPIDSLHAFLGASSANGNLYETHDGGSTWEVNQSYEDSPVYVHFFNENEGWVAGAENTTIRFGLTKDGGVTWTYIGGEDWATPEGTSIPDIIGLERPEIAYSTLNGSYDVKGNMIIMNMWGGTYWVSYDKGYNWERKYTPAAEAERSNGTVAIKDSLTYMFTGDLNTSYNLVPEVSYYTEDGGITWVTGNPSVNTSVGEYLEGTDNTFIVCGQFGNVQGTQVTTDGGRTWTKVDNTRIVAADFVASGKGIGVFGDASQFGNFDENGKVYEWSYEESPYLTNVVLNRRPTYTINTPRHLEDMTFEYTIQNVGTADLENVSADVGVLQDGVDVVFDVLELPTIAVDTSGFITNTYQPTAFGAYIYFLSLSQDSLGLSFYQDQRQFELSPTTMAKDDGSVDNGYGFGFGDPSWYGYYGSEFQLTQADTLTSITVLVASEEEDATFNLSLTSFNELGEPNAAPFFKTEPLAVSDAVELVYTYEFDEPIVVPSRFILAAGQDSLQGIVSFGFDENIRNEGYWIVSPVAGGGYPWSNPEQSLPTLMIRPHFTAAQILTSTQDIQAPTWDVQVYPTIFNEHLIVKANHPNYQNLELQLFDSNGKLLINKQIRDQVELSKGLESLPSGMYMLRIVAEDIQHTTKLMKQ